MGVMGRVKVRSVVKYLTGRKSEEGGCSESSRTCMAVPV